MDAWEPAVGAAELVAPEVVLAAILATIDPLPPRRTPLAQCAGRVVAQDVVAPAALPRFTNAAMDGFAVRRADLPGRLRIVGHCLAGEPGVAAIGAGQAAAIATGAVLPQGADTVVALEQVAGEGDRVAAPCPPAAGAHVRLAGEDVAAGQVVIPSGTMIGPGQLAACAACGIAELPVHPPARVAIVPTGTEVRPAGAELGPGQVYDAVSLPVAALVAALRAEARPLPPVPDDPAAIVAALTEAAAGADLVLTVGGVSAGERDLVAGCATGGQLRRFRLALRPGRPFACGTMFGRPTLGLPGNPGAALAVFEVIARPVILRLQGRQPAAQGPVRAVLTEPLEGDPGR